ncbi:MAG: RNA pseudouridine synthase, partial [Sphingomonadales bacterium]
MSGVEHRTVGDDEAGQRIDRWFKKHFPDLTYGRLSKLFRTGQVRLDGHRVKPGDRIGAGQDIRIPPIGKAPARRKPGGGAQSPELSDEDRARARDMLIYQDDDILVLNKEPGLPTQGGTGQ